MDHLKTFRSWANSLFCRLTNERLEDGRGIKNCIFHAAEPLVHPEMTLATTAATMRHEPIFRSIAVRTVTVLTAAALVVLIGAFAGGFVSGLAGFGTGLVAVGIWLRVIQPTTAATLVVVCSVVSQATGTRTGSSRDDRAVPFGHFGHS